MFDARRTWSPIAACVSWVYFVALGVLAVCGDAQAGSVQCEPSTVSFSSLDKSVVIHLSLNGKPLSAESVQGARVMIGDRNYSNQFIIERSKDGPAKLTVRPNPSQVQVGTFTLRIDTSGGPATATIQTPLDQLPGTLANRAKAMGISEDQLKAELKLLQPTKRERVSVQLPDSYPEGYVFKLPLGENPDHDYRWSINGEVVASGKGQGTLRYVFTLIGPNTIQFEERHQGGLIAAWSGTLTVSSTPTVPWEVPVFAEISLPGPTGFHNYTWRIDSEVVGRDSVLHHSFKHTGNHTIECLAKKPEQGDSSEYRRMTWNVTVR